MITATIDTPVESSNWRRPASLSVAEFLHALRQQRRLRPMLRSILAEKFAVATARANGLTTGNSELQLAANRFRMANGLSSAEATRKWLNAQQLTLADLEDRLETALLVEKFQQHLVDQHSESHFDANRARYDRARLRRLVAPSEGAAREFLCRVRDEGASFAELARDHDIDPTIRGMKGELGLVTRWQMPPAVAEAVFAAQPGGIVGPVASGQGFGLYLVEELLPAEMNDETLATIRQELYQVWVRERMKNVRIDLSGLA